MFESSHPHSSSHSPATQFQWTEQACVWYTQVSVDKTFTHKTHTHTPARVPPRTCDLVWHVVEVGGSPLCSCGCHLEAGVLQFSSFRVTVLSARTAF